MAETLITFKAGKCEFEDRKVRPDPTQGYLYLKNEDEMLHLCWRPRSAPSTDPEIDLIMFPGDCTFLPYLGPGKSADTPGEKFSPTNGRIFELKFSSSSQRIYFWLQSKSQHSEGNPSYFSKKDLLVGQIVHKILAGDETEWRRDLASLRRGGGEGGGDAGPSHDDDAMEDVQGGEPDLQRHGSGGAGPDATGGDPREEGEDSRRGGGDGGRAAPSDANDVVQNFLRSLQSSNTQSQQNQQQAYDKPFTSLPELLNTNNTVPYLKSASPEEIDRLCSHLPASIFLLSQESSDSLASTEPTPEAAKAAIEALSGDQKREILERVLRSPQLHQSLGSLTVALRDGGLPQIGEALGIDVEHGGLIRGGTMPVGGGEAVEKFLEGVKRSVEKK
ncbi:putative proteasome complex subunit Rpn13 ubiquitin receptor protein [Elsinoe australis]|uniref:Putative proteasome complex subunit Rpn13 ubiquitin receptor protein n=1 Tax=Elsinoe australis TaxID=40998 RepID=A0A4U7B7H5_9PEZI|nr:putative proteasome complex subunit Rpn13 ubiquitin receptor protein [Elsinoe australis]